MINQNCDFCQCKSRYFALSFTPKCHLFIQCAFANKISQILLLNLPADFTEAGASKKSAPFQACLVKTRAEKCTARSGSQFCAIPSMVWARSQSNKQKSLWSAVGDSKLINVSAKTVAKAYCGSSEEIRC